MLKLVYLLLFFSVSGSVVACLNLATEVEDNLFPDSETPDKPKWSQRFNVATSLNHGKFRHVTAHMS